jgi:hypothetical protein
VDVVAAFTTVVVALAGPVGVTLGWWLGRSSQRQKEARDERKAAYSNFIRAVLLYRAADTDTRRSI